jgi:very-short-patch-repair endonuclease
MTTIFNKSSMKKRRQVLRRNMPKAEIILWSRIRRKQIDGYRFRRQYSVGSYILDFYCPELKLAIEIDGDSHFHHSAEEYDKYREEEIQQLGVQFIRFQNTEVYKNLNGVLQTIYEKIELLRRLT